MATKGESASSVLKEKHIIVGLSGGIACYKIAELVSTLVQIGAVVDVLMTDAATRFIAPLTFESLTGRGVLDSQWKHIDGHTPQHITLASKADAMLIAPCTMDMLASLTHGFTDNPVSLVCSAINRHEIPVLVAPSMNVTMLNQPATQRNLILAADDGFTLLTPQEGWQACRAVGQGRMPDPESLLNALETALHS